MNRRHLKEGVALIAFSQLLLIGAWEIYAGIARHPHETVVPQQTEIPRNFLVKFEDRLTDVDGNVTSSSTNSSRLDVAISLAITFRGLTHPLRSPLFKDLIPTFCATASQNVDYYFYIGHDHDDPFFKQEKSHVEFKGLFLESLAKVNCSLSISIQLVECSYGKKPAWAQNDASWAAYLDHRTYYYRINDDTLIRSKGWTEAFVSQLRRSNPPFVGVVGPFNIGGAQHILTYEFVHRTHMDIFGYYYPRLFTDWWGDNWISQTYRPHRSTKLKDYIVKHTMEKGQRYATSWQVGKQLKLTVNKGVATVEAWVRRPAAPVSSLPSPALRVIATSLYGGDPKYTYGAVRNAVLVRRYFPGWTLRVYVEEKNSSRYPAVPDKIVRKLKLEAAQVLPLPNSIVSQIPPMMWRFLAADDLALERFVSRDLDGRLSDRDFVHVKAWEDSGAPFHCVRDHPSHSNYPISGGLWGAVPSAFRGLMKNHTMFNLIVNARTTKDTKFNDKYLQDMDFLNAVVWPKVNGTCLCHDAFSCDKFPGSKPVLQARPSDFEHMGQVFDAWGEARKGDVDILRRTKVKTICIPG